MTHSSLVMSPSLLELKYLNILSIKMSSVMLKLLWRNCLNSFLSILSIFVAGDEFTVILYKFNNFSISWAEKCVLLRRLSTIFFSCFLTAELPLFSDIVLQRILWLCEIFHQNKGRTKRKANCNTTTTVSVARILKTDNLFISIKVWNHETNIVNSLQEPSSL